MLAAMAFSTLAVGLTACGESDDGDQKQEQALPAEKLKNGASVAFERIGEEKTITVSEYIRTNGNEVKVTSSKPDVVEATLKDGVVTVKAVKGGSAVVMLSCGGVTVSFTVTSPVVIYTVTVDGKPVGTAEAGSEYVLPSADQGTAPEHPEDYDFVWSVNGEEKQPGSKIIVNENLVILSSSRQKPAESVKTAGTLTVNAGGSGSITVSDYILAHGREVSAESDAPSKVSVSVAVEGGGTVTVNGLERGSANITLTCGDVTAVISVTVQAADAPIYADKAVAFDLYESESGSCTFERTGGVDGTYAFAIDGTVANASIAGDVLTYSGGVTEEPLEITVNVTKVGEADVLTTFKVTVTVSDSTPAVLENAVVIEEEKDFYELTDNRYSIDLAENVTHTEHVKGYSVNGTALKEGVSVYSMASSGYTETAQRVTLTVAVTLTNGDTLNYSYTVTVKDTSAYRIQNGGFENGTAGWTGTNGHVGSDDTYFGTYPINKEGKNYYVGVDQGTETVVSSAFVVGNSGWITFKLGSMRPNEGNTLREIYLEVVDQEDNAVIAVVRNILWSDPDAALKLNDYKLDLSQYKGKTVFLRAVDHEDGGDFRSLYLDGVNTWWDSKPGSAYTDLSSVRYWNTTASIDLKDTNTATVTPVFFSRGLIGELEALTGTADKSGLSVNGYTLTASKSGNYTVTYSLGGNAMFTVAVTVTNTAELPEFDDMSLTVKVGEQGQLQLPVPEADGRFAYAYSVDGGSVDENGLFTFSSAEEGKVSVTVTLTLTDTKYLVEDELTVTFRVNVSVAGDHISLAGEDHIEEEFDVKDQENRETLTVDFAKYLVIPNGKTVTYEVKMDGEPIELSDAGQYTLVYSELGLTDVQKTVEFSVKATEGTTVLEYTVILRMTDTAQYRVENGGFEKGNLDGWSMTGDIGAVSDINDYWGGLLYQKEGQYFFCGKEGKNESTIGTLTSPAFKVGGSGYITYRYGSAGHWGEQFVEIVEKSSGTVLSRYVNVKYVDAGAFDANHPDGVNKVSGLTLIKYKADLTAFMGKTVYLRITDKWQGGGLGFVQFDDLVTYYASADEIDASYCEAEDCLYAPINAGFESGNLFGWTMAGDIGGISHETTYWEGINHQKDGEYFFWGSENKKGTDGEGNAYDRTGTLSSSTFVIGGNGWITFRLGGINPANNSQYIEIVDAETGNALVRYVNPLFADAGAFDGNADKISGLSLSKYKADLSEYIGKSVYIRITDRWEGGGFGFVLFDDVRTVYSDETLALLDGFTEAKNVLLGEE